MAKNATRKENPFGDEGFSVRRVPYTGHDGCKRKSRHWYIRFKDHGGKKWHQLKGFTDKTASVRFARKLVKLVGYRATNERPDAELSKWVGNLPDAVREKLIGWDILDRRAGAASEALCLHTEDWWKSIIHNKRTSDHADTSLARVDKIIKGCGFRRFADIDQLAIEDWLSCNVDSLGTRNHYVRAIRGFCRWMVCHGRALSSPVATLKLVNVETDRKRVRRALSIEELQKLIDAAENGPRRGRTTGHERALIYQTAVETGYRASELRSLTAADFDLASDPPTVRIKASAKGNKARREARLTLSAELAAKMRLHLANKAPAAPAFNVPCRTADMLKADLERAKIPYVDPNTGEVFDFHSLRVQTATILARAGVHPAIAQQRMRHSTIDLTMGIYTRLNQDDQAAAVAAMPKLSTGA